MDPIESYDTLERQLFHKATQRQIPIYGCLELSPLCNMNCDMCYVRLSPAEMKAQGRLRTVDELLALSQEMKEAGTLFLLLTGGEPLLFPDFRRLFIELQKMGMILTINTNGTLITEEWAEFFGRNKPRRINITLYGSSEKTYHNLCHYPKGFEQTVNGIHLLKKYEIDIKINGSLVKANVDDRIKMLELGETLDIPVRIDTYMYPATRERIQPYNLQSRLDPEKAATARVEILRREMGEDTFQQYLAKTLYEASHTPPGSASPGCMTCKAGKCSFIVNWQGQMRSCIVLDSPTIPVFETGFQAAWKEIVQKTNQIRTSNTCSQCTLRKVCNTCAASAMAECGAYDGTPDYICRYTKQTIQCLKEISANL